ncbi:MULTISPECIES: hypothetical protein [Bacillus cereus group]|uniref:Uncharacterized protein n=2 Tax=Bacillus cereus group TaxID=86661 RepID=R8Q0J5_BACCE|nr:MULTISPECIES: hypothetical protein [Bacillus cereus group]EOP64630.1 hypothetical protein IIQ_03347 [Bacillus cereus VD118]MCQ6358291.1 hypothetical protein [Bacillus cereus]SCB70426.1 Uncharacterized protein BWGO95_04596 [Bacillus mycoides]
MINDAILDAAKGKTGIQLGRANRPLVIADIKNYRGHSFLVAHVTDNARTVGQIIAPMQDITSLAGKINEIVEASCDRETPIAYDLYTPNDAIYNESLSSLYALPQMKPKSACNECSVIMDDKRTQEAIDDIYINEVEAQEQEKQETKERSARGKLKQFFKTMRDKLAGFMHSTK